MGVAQRDWVGVEMELQQEEVEEEEESEEEEEEEEEEESEEEEEEEEEEESKKGCNAIGRSHKPEVISLCETNVCLHCCALDIYVSAV